MTTVHLYVYERLHSETFLYFKNKKLAKQLSVKKSLNKQKKAS